MQSESQKAVPRSPDTREAPRDRPAVESSRLVVPIDAPRQIQRIAAIQDEIAKLGDRCVANGGGRPADSLLPQAPGTIIRKPAARYRMPREVKQQLIDRFVHNASPDHERPRAMIIVAHQDDETVGAGARLCALGDAWVVHVTDGAPADPATPLRYGFKTRDEYAAARRQELSLALDVAGILPEHRLCLNYVDGEASLQMVDLVLRIADLIDNINPDIIITHPYEGGHTDHDATAFAVHLASGLLRREGLDPPAVLEMTSYHRREGRRVVHEFLPHKRADLDQRVVQLDGELQRKKQQMYDCFGTQQGIIKTFNTSLERFRPAPRYLFTAPPHDGELNYERFGDPLRGERWRRDARIAMAELKLRKSA